MSDLAIVLLNWNRAESTCDCLARLKAWTEIEPDVWVVDNGSADSSVATIREAFPTVPLIESAENLGFGGGNNLALREISAEYVLLLNNDAAITEASVLCLLEALRGDPSMAIAGPLIVDPEDHHHVLAAGGRDISIHPSTHLRPRDLPAPARELTAPFAVDYIPGTAVLLRTAVVRQVGLLEEEYFFGGELADLGEQVRRLGYTAVVVPEARAWHDLDTASEFRRSLYPYYIVRNRFLFVRKFRHRARAPLTLFWSAYGLALAMRAAARADWVKARLATLAIHDGVRGRFGGQNERVLS